MTDSDIQAVREVLQRFQDGYDRRDVSVIDDFKSLFINGEEMEVIGTGGIIPGDDEWCLGPDAACALVKSDWEGWGDLRLDVEDSHIFTRGDVAWLATTGSVSTKLERDKVYEDYLQYMKTTVDNQELSPTHRILEILRGSSNTIFEVERGENFTWPIRFTAVLVREQNTWLFHQIQFSFATTRFPDVRNL